MSEWEIVEEINKEEMKGNASIRVIGVGGGGGNAVQHMVVENIGDMIGYGEELMVEYSLIQIENTLYITFQEC